MERGQQGPRYNRLIFVPRSLFFCYGHLDILSFYLNKNRIAYVVTLPIGDRYCHCHASANLRWCQLPVCELRSPDSALYGYPIPEIPADALIVRTSTIEWNASNEPTGIFAYFKLIRSRTAQDCIRSVRFPRKPTRWVTLREI